jgi:hypothetical protein
MSLRLLSARTATIFISRVGRTSHPQVSLRTYGIRLSSLGQGAVYQGIDRYFRPIDIPRLFWLNRNVSRPNFDACSEDSVWSSLGRLNGLPHDKGLARNAASLGADHVFLACSTPILACLRRVGCELASIRIRFKESKRVTVREGSDLCN